MLSRRFYAAPIPGSLSEPHGCVLGVSISTPVGFLPGSLSEPHGCVLGVSISTPAGFLPGSFSIHMAVSCEWVFPRLRTSYLGLCRSHMAVCWEWVFPRLRDSYLGPFRSTWLCVGSEYFHDWGLLTWVFVGATWLCIGSEYFHDCRLPHPYTGDCVYTNHVHLGRP